MRSERTREENGGKHEIIDANNNDTPVVFQNDTQSNVQNEARAVWRTNKKQKSKKREGEREREIVKNSVKKG